MSREPWWAGVLGCSGYVMNSIKKCICEYGIEEACVKYGRFNNLGMDDYATSMLLRHKSESVGKAGALFHRGWELEEKDHELRLYIEKKYFKRIFCAGRRSWMYQACFDYVRKEFCELCGAKSEIIHHIKPYATFKEGRSLPSNLINLCRKCHLSEHKKLRDMAK